MTSSLNDTYYLTVENFFHQSFTDISLISPKLFARGMTPEHNVDITRSYALAFLTVISKERSSRYCKALHLSFLRLLMMPRIPRYATNKHNKFARVEE